VHSMCSFDRSLQQVAALGCLQVYTCSFVSTMHTALSADPQVHQFGTSKRKNFLGGSFQTLSFVAALAEAMYERLHA
jgi:hypothetical protein